MIHKILYNVGFIWILTMLSGVISIKSQTDSIVFYSWIIIMFNFLMFFQKKSERFKRVSLLLLVSVFPFVLSGILTSLTGKPVLNIYQFYYTYGNIIFQPYMLHLLLGTLIATFAKVR